MYEENILQNSILKCLMLEGRKEEPEGGRKGEGRRLLPCDESRSVEKTDFSYSRSESLTETGLKQNQNRGSKTNVLQDALNVEELTQFLPKENCPL